jgi:predicted Ser/Thr protein kinase
MEAIQKTANSIRKLVVGIIISEYALRELSEGSKFDLKNRARIAINAAKRVQDYFKDHPETTPEHKAIFEKEFIKSEIYMLSELMETVWGLSDDSLEEIINAIKGNIGSE